MDKATFDNFCGFLNELNTNKNTSKVFKFNPMAAFVGAGWLKCSEEHVCNELNINLDVLIPEASQRESVIRSIRNLAGIKHDKAWDFVQDINGNYKSEASLTFALLLKHFEENKDNHENMDLFDAFSDAFKKCIEEPNLTVINILKGHIENNNGYVVHANLLSGNEISISIPQYPGNYSINREACENLQLIRNSPNLAFSTCSEDTQNDGQDFSQDMQKFSFKLNNNVQVVDVDPDVPKFIQSLLELGIMKEIPAQTPPIPFASEEGRRRFRLCSSSRDNQCVTQ